MKLLVLTQIVDKNDANLGFFNVWLKHLAERAEKLTVICLQKGDYDLPAKVKVISLGKEQGKSRWQYLKNFYRFIFQYRQEYDHIFVHMNQEYVILGGLFWRLWKKKVLFWYVHKAVNLRLRLATIFATKIFTASKESFRLDSRKVEIVGHGIDVSKFQIASVTPSLPRRQAGSPPPIRGRISRLLYVGRISPVKDLETVILAFRELMEHHPEREILLDIVGDTITAADEEYRQTLLDLTTKLRLSPRVQFLGGVHYVKMPEVYAAHQALIHTSRTGSMDKVVLEALASGLMVLTSSAAYNRLGDLVWRFPPNEVKELAALIETRLLVHPPEVNQAGREYVAREHNLTTVVDKMVAYFRE